MNLLQVILTTFRLYTAHVGWYIFAALLLFLSFLVGAGMFSGSLLASMVLAIPYGVDGGWIREPVAVLLIGGCLGVGALTASWFILVAAGSFAHTCAQIGSGVREVTVIGFLEYAKKSGPTFWLIIMTQLVFGTIISLPFLALAIVLEGIWPPLLIVGLAAGAIAFFLAQWPLWLAASAQVVERRGFIASIRSSLSCARRAPISVLVAVAICGAAFLIPTPMLFFYPLYFFFVYMPLSTVFGLVYYESAKGLMR